MTTATSSLIFPSSGRGSDLAEVEDIPHKYEEESSIGCCNLFLLWSSK